MKNRVVRIVVFVLVTVVMATTMGCSKTAKPGWVGIKVNNWGAQRGVRDFPYKTGRIFYNPAKDDVYLFPTFLQNVVWTRNLNEGKALDESITITSAEGAAINCDVGIGVSVEADSVPYCFVNYHMEMEALLHGPLHTETRDCLIRRGGKMKTMDILGPQVGALLDSAKADLNNGMFGRHGFKFDYVTFVSRPRPDSTVEKSINLVIESTQRAQQAHNKILEAKALAEQKVETAKGDSLAAVISAKGYAEANRMLNESLSDRVIEWKKLDKWNGVVPQVVTGAGTSTLVSVK